MTPKAATPTLSPKDVGLTAEVVKIVDQLANVPLTGDQASELNQRVAEIQISLAVDASVGLADSGV